MMKNVSELENDVWIYSAIQTLRNTMQFSGKSFYAHYGICEENSHIIFTCNYDTSNQNQ